MEKRLCELQLFLQHQLSLAQKMGRNMNDFLVSVQKMEVLR